MTNRILLTALSSNNQRRGMSYYCAKDLRERTLYCDALLTAEASCKYALSAYQVDEIIVFGREDTEQPDPEEALPLRQRKEALSYDIETASGFSVLLYRLTQSFDGVITIFQTLKFIYNGFLQGVGMMKEAAFCSIAAFSCVNLLMVALLVLVFHWEIWGVWIGSLVSQFTHAFMLRRYIAKAPVFSGVKPEEFA